MEKDLRERVSGAASKLEELASRVPGYSGYKEREQRREADKLLRIHLAQKFDEKRRRINGLQLQLTDKGRLSLVVTLERAHMKLQLLIDRLKTATYGYAGLFDAVKVEQAELDALYEFDSALNDGVAQVSKTIDLLQSAIREEDAEMSKLANDLVMTIEEINETFSRRQDVILQL